jgi:hypothetical protein
MKHLNDYTNFLNEAWFPGKKRLMNEKERLEKEGEELRKKRDELDKKRKEMDKKEKEAFDKLHKELNEHLKDYLNKKYKFQYQQIVWKSQNSNYPEIDVADFTFNELKADYRMGLGKGDGMDMYFMLRFTDRYNKVVEIMFDENSPTEKKLDLEYCKPWDMKSSTILMGNYVDKTDIDYDNPKSYPHKADYMELVPAAYDTYNLLGELKTLIVQANELIKQRKEKKD